MRNVIIALAAAGILAAALPSPVHANCNGCGVAAGVVGGLAAGAIVGSSTEGNAMSRYGAADSSPYFDASNARSR